MLSCDRCMTDKNVFVRFGWIDKFVDGRSTKQNFQITTIEKIPVVYVSNSICKLFFLSPIFHGIISVKQAHDRAISYVLLLLLEIYNFYGVLLFSWPKKNFVQRQIDEI